MLQANLRAIHVASSRTWVGGLLAVALAAGALATGCGRTHVESLSITSLPAPGDVTSQAIQSYDRDGDRTLSTAELLRSPSLQSQRAVLDLDSNGSVSSDELEQRVARIAERGVTFFMLPCRIELDGKAVGSAEITLEPEEFWGITGRAAHGVTTRDGRTFLKTEGEPRAGVYAGYYRVRISRKDDEGRELIPSKFNSASQIGTEIGIMDSEQFEDGELVLALSSN